MHILFDNTKGNMNSFLKELAIGDIEDCCDSKTFSKGEDYYDNEYILGYLELNYNDDKYPTIDHKVSILEGFKNNISHKIIADIQNLCITKRILNTQKGFKNSMEFFEKLKGVNSL